MNFLNRFKCIINFISPLPGLGRGGDGWFMENHSLRSGLLSVAPLGLGREFGGDVYRGLTPPGYILAPLWGLIRIGIYFKDGGHGAPCGRCMGLGFILRS